MRGWGFRSNHDEGNWHAYDYALFYMNVRQNAQRRVEAFLDRGLDRSPAPGLGSDPVGASR